MRKRFDYEPSLSLIAKLPSFAEVAEAFREHVDGIKSRDELLGEYLKMKSLEQLCEMGYLKEIDSGNYYLTDKGKRAYFRRMAHQKKIEKSVSKGNY